MRKLVFIIPIFLWLIISTILLTLPGSAFPQEDWFDKIWFDKWIHIGMFGIMAFLSCWAIYKRGAPVPRLFRYFLIAGLLCLAYGIMMEFVQKYFVPNRSFDPSDIVSDAIGSLIGVWFSRRVYIKK